jgi:hypothetical protein
VLLRPHGPNAPSSSSLSPDPNIVSLDPHTNPTAILTDPLVQTQHHTQRTVLRSPMPCRDSITKLVPYLCVLASQRTFNLHTFSAGTARYGGSLVPFQISLPTALLSNARDLALYRFTRPLACVTPSLASMLHGSYCPPQRTGPYPSHKTCRALVLRQGFLLPPHTVSNFDGPPSNFDAGR